MSTAVANHLGVGGPPDNTRETRHAQFKTSFRTQANALLRKNAKQQLRSWKVNLCLLSCAVLFPLMMVVAQAAISNAIASEQDGKCGCKCIRCCREGNETNCFDPETRNLFICPEDYRCKKRDTNICGFQYSTSRQSAYCRSPNPNVWPAVWKIPRFEYRAQPWAPGVAFLYTGSDLDTASSLMNNFFTTPPAELDMAQAQSVLRQFGASLRNGVYMGDVFSRLNYNLSTAQIAERNLYTDPAFTGGRNVTNLVRDCATDVYTASLRLVTEQLAGAIEGDSANQRLAGLNTTYNCTNVVLLRNATTSDLNRQLYCGFGRDAGCGLTSPQQYANAWDFQNTGRQLWNISMYYNNTDLPYEGGGPYLLQRVNAGFNMAASAWLKWALQGDWAVRLYGLQAFPTVATERFVDFATLLGPIFYTWLLALLQPVIVYNIVYEKANRLRVMMAVHGLGDTPYWLIQYAYWFVLYIIFIIILSVFSTILRLSLFTKTAAILQIVLYIIWGFNMISFAFLLSALFKSPKTATTTIFIYVFGVALLAAQLLDRYIGENRWWLYLLQLIPELALYRALFEISNRASLARTYGNNYFAPKFSNAEMSGLGAALISLAVQIPIFVLVALYLDKVVPSAAGVHQHWLFCLPGARKRQQRRMERETATASHMLEMVKPAQLNASRTASNKASDEISHDVESLQDKKAAVLEEIINERERVAAIDETGTGYSVVIRNLVKVFPRSWRHSEPKVACGGVSFAVRKGECFGLLGPNGAGKTTLLSMLTGFLEPTSGRALLDGLDVRTNVKDIYHLLGVCPQQDLLWENLTAREHLLFYGRLKNLRGQELHDAVQTTLDAVNLGQSEVANKVAGQYSGGMKRRLSVAISLMGKPPVILTDECSTGLDPSSRRTLWAAINAAKQHSGIILTTHSMEEAAVLCDRLGIFVDGQLVVLGNPKYLGQRYGGYLVFTLTTPPQQEAAAAQLVMQMCPTARQMYALGGTQKYELPTQDISLAKVFVTMHKASEELQIEDWGVANATLEEVFIKFARQTGVQGGS